MVILILIAVISLFILIYGSDSKVVGETPCVDGFNRVNLEGIMCEELQESWFGLSAAWSFVCVIPIILFGIFIYLSQR